MLSSEKCISNQATGRCLGYIPIRQYIGDTIKAESAPRVSW